MSNVKIDRQHYAQRCGFTDFKNKLYHIGVYIKMENKKKKNSYILVSS
jgi:hypothetical protein